MSYINIRKQYVEITINYIINLDIFNNSDNLQTN
jgi:hypothetical protein